MKKLILIRHAETDYTSQGRYCGHQNIPLNKKGILQAKRLRLKLKNMKIDKIYSSDLRRSYETAKTVFPNRIILKKKGLREIDFGKLTGLTWEEAHKTYPKAYKTWLNNPSRLKIPNGESLRSFAKRVSICFDKIAQENSEKVTLVTHGGPIRIILLKIMNQGLDKFWTIEQDTAAINVIEFNPSQKSPGLPAKQASPGDECSVVFLLGREPRSLDRGGSTSNKPRILKINDTSHLGK